MNTDEERALFRLLDDYSRTHHRCFVAEFFRAKPQEGYFACIRPLVVSAASPNRYACVYVTISEQEADVVIRLGNLPKSLIGTLVGKLQGLERLT